jgi:hypothetical protein
MIQLIDMQETTKSGNGLLALGLLSLIFGPFTAIPGLLLAKKFRPFSPTASVGYFLCWFFLVLSVLAFFWLFLASPSEPITHQ